MISDSGEGKKSIRLDVTLQRWGLYSEKDDGRMSKDFLYRKRMVRIRNFPILRAPTL